MLLVPDALQICRLVLRALRIGLLFVSPLGNDRLISHCGIVESNSDRAD